MPAATIITTRLLDAWEFPSAWRPLIVGLTKKAAADVLIDILDGRAATRGLNAVGMTTYTLDGQNVTATIAEVEMMRRFIAQWKIDGGGPIFAPAMFVGYCDPACP